MSQRHDEYHCEPIRGLPEKLPPGEVILWQGAPAWWPLAKQAFHIRTVGLYFVVLIAVHAAVHAHETGTVSPAVILSPVPIAALILGLLASLSWLCCRTTVYTITNRRVVLRIGIALPMAINVPFKMIGGAGLKLRDDGTGDIPLSPAGNGRMGYVALWPHVRPWRLKSPEPMLRSISDAKPVADLLGKALRDALDVQGGAAASSTDPADGGQSAMVTGTIRLGLSS